MSEFGWAFISCSAGTGGGGTASGQGPTGSIQFHTASGGLSGSAQLLFLTSSNTLRLTGTLDVSGTINANEFNINVVNRDIVNLSATGSTKFGDTADDKHQFSGSVYISGNLFASGAVQLNYYRVTSTVYTASADDYIIGVSTSSGVTVRLPQSTNQNTGRILVIKDEMSITGGRPETPAGQIAISASAGSSNLIDGNGYVALAGDNASITLYSSGDGNWFIT